MKVLISGSSGYIGSNLKYYFIKTGCKVRELNKDSIIGACSLVNNLVEEYSISYGIPCKIVGYRK